MSNKLQGWLAPNTLTEDTNDWINDIYVSFTQNRVLREEIRNTKVEIQGEKADAIYITGVQDCSNNVKDGHITPGRNFRIEGTDENVGISFRSLTDDTVTKVTPDMFGTNNPSELIFIAPTGLADGEYEMTLTTQYSGNTQRILKTARSVSRIVYIGTNKGEEGEDDRPVIE